MKKVASIFAVVMMSVGLFTSCEDDTNVADNDALYELQDKNAGDGEYNEPTERE